MLSYKVLSPFYKGMQEHPIPSPSGPIWQESPSERSSHITSIPGKLSRICEIQSAVTSAVLLDAAIRYTFPASYSFLKVVSNYLCIASLMAFIDFFMSLHFWKTSSLPVPNFITGLILRRLAASAVVVLIRPPFFRYSSVLNPT